MSRVLRKQKEKYLVLYPELKVLEMRTGKVGKVLELGLMHLQNILLSW